MLKRCVLGFCALGGKLLSTRIWGCDCAVDAGGGGGGLVSFSGAEKPEGSEGFSLGKEETLLGWIRRSI